MEGLFPKVWARRRENRVQGGTLRLAISRAVTSPRLEGVSYQTQKGQNHVGNVCADFFKK